MAFDLPDFASLKGPWPSLFVGNGASINISSGFQYQRLFDEAVLSSTAAKLFNELDTTNFELVLRLLADARTVTALLDQTAPIRSAINSEYGAIQRALFTAVNHTHVLPADVPDQTFQKIADELQTHSKVFTTNYDLLLYWSLNRCGDRNKFVDYFMRTTSDLTFDLTNTDGFAGRTQLFNLHGGLHLWQDPRTGITGKWENRPGLNLLDLTARLQAHPERDVLLVSEGTATDKRRAINTNAYLSFALLQLSNDGNDIVLFGTNLGDVDQHIVDALKSRRGKRIAISLRPMPEKALRARTAHLEAMFEDHDVYFFGAQTHPLGDPALHIN